MGSADGVYIVSLEDIKILKDVLYRCCMSVDRVRIVAVNALDFYLLTVEIKNGTGYRKIFYSELYKHNLVRYVKEKIVEQWSLVAPKDRIVKFYFKFTV